MAGEVVELGIGIVDHVKRQGLGCCRPHRTAVIGLAMMGYDHVLKDESKVPGEVLYQRYLLLYHGALIWVLQFLAIDVGADAMVITEGYRTEDDYKYLVKRYDSKRVAKKSFHMDGLAADVTVSIAGKSAKEAYDVLRGSADYIIGNSGGMKCYPTENFIHIDIRGVRYRENCK